MGRAPSPNAPADFSRCGPSRREVFDVSEGTLSYAPVFYGLLSAVALAGAGYSIYANDHQAMLLRFATPLGMLVVALVPFFSAGPAELQQNIISVGNLCSEVLIFIIAIGISEILRLDPFKSFATVRVTLTVVGIAITGIATQLRTSVNDPLVMTQVSFVLIGIGVLMLVVMLIIVSFSLRRDTENQEAPEPVQEGADTSEENPPETPVSDDSPSQFDRRCAELAETYGLSAREQEVFALLARGYASSRIQQELFIAAGTVSYHCHNIYSKLGIHSKQELIDFVNRKQ